MPIYCCKILCKLGIWSQIFSAEILVLRIVCSNRPFCKGKYQFSPGWKVYFCIFSVKYRYKTQVILFGSVYSLLCMLLIFDLSILGVRIFSRLHDYIVLWTEQSVAWKCSLPNEQTRHDHLCQIFSVCYVHLILLLLMLLLTSPKISSDRLVSAITGNYTIRKGRVNDWY